VRPADDLERLRPTLRRRLVRLLDEPGVGEVLLAKGGFDVSLLAPLRALVRDDDGTRAAGLVSDAMVDAFYVAGSPERIRRRIAEYRAAGVRLPLLLPRLEDFAEVARTAA
jgi:alkanesulfonate monooxygenase SsuD/methylene tetrahydromethanopterin reductase-like flavin-dependent oxidoreductase (luciferase family)